jgi:Sec-independent protein translocase protein TatA
MEIVRGIRFKKYLEEEAEKKRNQLAESSKESKRNKKEQTTSEKLQEKLEPLSPCPMSDE